MAQLIMALGIVAALAYFIFFRTPDEESPIKAPTAYQTEIGKAQAVEQVLQESADRRMQAGENEDSAP